MKGFLAVAAIIAALMLASCGGHRSAGLPIQQASDNPRSQRTLAELDALSCPQGVGAELWAELKGALEVALGKAAATPPTGDANRVNDLGITDNGDGSYTLTWHYHNLGDYGQDGKVGISDITPIAQHFGETYDIETEPNSIQAVIDGSGNGKVDIADVTPIAQRFGIEVADYLIEGAMALEGPFSEVETVSVDEATGGESGRAVLAHLLTPGEYSYFRVTARDAAGTPGEPSNTVGLALQILSVTPTEVKEGTVVTFSAEVLGAGPLTYEWDFGGGAQFETYTDPSPRVVLTRETGEFPASLTVTNPVGEAAYPFTLSKLAREWKYEAVLSTNKEYETVGTRGLCEHEGTLYCFAYVQDNDAFAIVERYLISGSSGHWQYEDIDWFVHSLDTSSAGMPGLLAYSGSFMNYTLKLAEKRAGTWVAEAVQSGIQLPGDDFAYTDGDVPFVAYIYRNYVPELAVELHYARRVDGEWLYGVIDDAGGPGGEVEDPIVMRVDPEGNPAVAYRAVVEDRKELRLARWNPSMESWEKEQMAANLESQYDLAFDQQDRPCFIFADYGSSTETLAVYYGRWTGGILEREIIQEWPKEEVMNVLSSFNLAYDPLGNPLAAAYVGGGRVDMWWNDGTSWQRCASVIQDICNDTSTGAVLRSVMTQQGTPCFSHIDYSRKEVMLVSYE